MYNKKENYCTCSPDELFGVRFNHACYLHDRQYRNEVKNRKTRKQADIDLKNRIINSYKKSNKKYIGILIGNLYYVGARLLGLITWVK